MVPKPPAPKKPDSSALAAAAAVIPTTPPITPLQFAMDEAAKINIKDAGVHFNGECLPSKNVKEIKSVSCKMNFSNLFDIFD